MDLCIVGADRVTAKGDVANKIGTYLKALAAKDNAVPFYVALPSSTIDWQLSLGARHPHRGALGGRAAEDGRPAARRRACHGGDCRAGQPGRQSRLRVTPARLVTGFITERGVCPKQRGLKEPVPSALLSRPRSPPRVRMTDANPPPHCSRSAARKRRRKASRRHPPPLAAELLRLVRLAGVRLAIGRA